MNIKAVLLLLSCSALAACPAFASGVNVNFNFGGPDQVLGTSASYTSGPATVTAFGYECSASDSSSTGTLSNCTANNLFQKMDGPNETGLGLSGQMHGNEIGWDGPNADFVMGLDVSSLFKLGAASMTLTFGSVESGEGFAVFGFASNPFNQSSFALTNTVASGANNGGPRSSEVLSTTIALNAQDQFLVLISPCSGGGTPSGNCNSNVTLMSLTSTASTPTATTPEPGTIALFGAGLLLLGTILRRKWCAVLES